MMAAYKGSDVADNEEDVRHIEKAKRTAEQLVSRKAADSSAGQRAKKPPPPPEQQSQLPSQPVQQSDPNSTPVGQ